MRESRSFSPKLIMDVFSQASHSVCKSWYLFFVVKQTVEHSPDQECRICKIRKPSERWSQIWGTDYGSQGPKIGPGLWCDDDHCGVGGSELATSEILWHQSEIRIGKKVDFHLVGLVFCAGIGPFWSQSGQLNIKSHVARPVQHEIQEHRGRRDCHTNPDLELCSEMSTSH